MRSNRSNRLHSPTVKDRLAIHKMALRLTTIHKAIAAAVVIIVAWIWIALIRHILHFGRTLDYSGLEAFGLEADLIKQYNPYFWWTVIAICTLLVTYVLFNFVQYTRRKASQKTVPKEDLEDLLHDLSPAATQVINWSWNNRRHPIDVGVLQQSASQLGVNRYDLICLAKDQEALIERHSQPVEKPTQKESSEKEVLHHL